MTDEPVGWVRADELQDKRLDNLEQRVILLEQTLAEIKTVLKVLRPLMIAVGSVLGLNIHQIML
jgi:tetrahydromethanopterin S-methyltransferase subunit G